MNKDWSELNKKMQLQLKKRDTFVQGIETLLRLRGELMTQILQLRDLLPADALRAIPFPNAKGYHSKSIVYSGLCRNAFSESGYETDLEKAFLLHKANLVDRVFGMVTLATAVSALRSLLLTRIPVPVPYPQPGSSVCRSSHPDGTEQSSSSWCLKAYRYLRRCL